MTPSARDRAIETAYKDIVTADPDDGAMPLQLAAVVIDGLIARPDVLHALAGKPAEVGRCGDQASGALPGPPLCCRLPAGHDGWHRDGHTDCEWGPVADELTAVAAGKYFTNCIKYGGDDPEEAIRKMRHVFGFGEAGSSPVAEPPAPAAEPTPADTCNHGRSIQEPCETCTAEGVPRERDRIMLAAEWRTLIHNVHKVGEHGWHWRCGVYEFRDEACQYDQRTDSYQAMVTDSLFHLRRYHDITPAAPAAVGTTPPTERVEVAEKAAEWARTRLIDMLTTAGEDIAANTSLPEALDRAAAYIDPPAHASVPAHPGVARVLARCDEREAEARRTSSGYTFSFRHTLSPGIATSEVRALLAGGEQQ